ncbi:hypothetical protein BKE38_04380 [Pseudoroseomonas deserti]|uniref:Uncharacterized protein n=1 Tax=Teichococcus deserti TaxID=1817963 RepID=A0A1V2H8E1_9PROT|nr:hypothetical protein [Pseudoroseomonas deserti]ONG57290.1 hypothetical protein BKE38_04380 [Pseudoroseomonas deserti]
MACAPQRGLARLRHHDAALKPTPPPFTIDPGRLYDVREDGRVFTEQAHDALPQRERRHLIRACWYLAVAANAVTMAGAAAGYVLAGRGVAAGFGLAVVVSLPLLAVAPLLDWRRQRGRRQWHDHRPTGFG